MDFKTALTSLRFDLGALIEIDLRSLGLFRIGVALTLLVDLVFRVRDLNALYGASGVLPPQLARALWDRYTAAYEKLLARCSMPHAPWYVIPANHKWHRNLAVASVLVAALEGLGSRYPRPTLSPARVRRLRAALAR